MRFSRPALLSSSTVSIFVFLFLSFAFSPSLAIAQGAVKKTLPAPIGDTEQDHPEQRAQWNMRGREAPKGETAAALRLRAHQQKMAMRARQAEAAMRSGKPLGTVQGWVSLGPSPLASDATGNGGQNYNWVSGRATSVLIDPGDSTGNTILLGGAYGGLWKSTNAGSQTAGNPDSVVWQSLIDDQPSLAVGAIAIQPGNSNVILVGTGETNASGDSYYGMGILRSTDGGASWTQITSAASGQSFLGIGFSKMAFSTSNTNLVVASTAGDIGFDYGLEQDGSSTARGIYYSTDAGATWNRVTLTDGAVPASVTGVVYNATQGAFYAAIRRHGIYSSTDGQHFARLTTQPTAGLASANCPANSNSSNCPLYRAEFAVTPGRNEMYVWVVDATTGPVDDGIWRTVNGGTAWTSIPDTGITTCGDGGGCGVSQATYNLELAAVPNSSGTDVYGGTINLYKCTLTSNTKTACSQGDWINLTHVYGCNPLGALAHVHPDQHGLGFMVVGSKSPGYFAHDGGISRTLDGFTGLNTGSCSGTNQFDSLSQTLGSMTEFVSFSLHPTSADILLGGTQDNGSPRTATATSSTQWQNALGGDGGYNAINPNNPSEWFDSNPNSVIQICTDGTSCNDNDTFVEASPPFPGFSGNIDTGAFYTPFILDPQSTSEMLIGTCRIWRGLTTLDENPGVFTQLSNNFDTGTSASCNGGEVNQVAALAAGGPTSGGLSNVVYATTWGYGPFAGLGGGEVWATTNAAGGTSTVANVTGSINPNHYAIGSVAIDASVANGQTAYVGIMGFHTSHVWKTTNAGGAWSDWTGSGGTALPDAPVSSLLVDSGAGLIYAGTDVGVFVSSTSTPSWTEVGPAATSGPGFLPSAPVTAIQMFVSGTTKLLRVSTYGRGIWEYTLAVGSATTTTLTSSQNPADFGSPVTFTATVTTVGSNPPTGTVTFNNGTSSLGTGTLSTVSGSQVATLTTSGLPSGSDSITAVYGGDANNAGSTSAVLTQTITAPTFTLSVPTTPATILAGQSTTSTFTVTATGSGVTSFAGNVTFACSGLPDTTVSCTFSPTQITAGTLSPVPVTLTIATTGPNQTPIGRQRPRHAENRTPWLPLGLPLAGIIIVGIAGRKVSKYSLAVSMCLALTLLGALLACGGGGSSTPPAINVSVSQGSPSSIYPNNSGWPSQTATFTATVSNDSSGKGVSWSASTGTIQSTGATTATYTAPMIVTGLPSSATITATSVADTSKSGTGAETLIPATVPGQYSLRVSATESTTNNSQGVTLTVQ